MYAVKSDSAGAFLKVKARLTLRGDLQKPPDDDTIPLITYAPTMKFYTLRALLSLYVNRPGVKFYQMDLTAAYVTAPVARPTYIKTPPGRTTPFGAGATLQVKRSLYGGKEAAYQFYKDQLAFHESHGFQAIHADQCYLHLYRGDEFIRIVFHVDDYVICCSGDEIFKWYVDVMETKYKIKIEPLNYFLGVAINIDKDGAVLDQAAQVQKTLKAFGMEDCKPAATPYAAGRQPSMADVSPSAEDEKEVKSFPYREVVGSLGYLQQATHPEITFPLKIASKFVRGWGSAQVKLVKHVLRYLRRSQNNHHRLEGKHNGKLELYTDASHIGCPDTRRSVSGYVIKLGEDTIDFGAHYQPIVSHSSYESELIALDHGCRRLQHMRWLVEAMGAPVQGTINVYVDSQAVIDMTRNPLSSTRTAHIHARYFRCRDWIEDGSIRLVKVPSEEQQADLLVAFKGPKTFNHMHGLVKGQQGDMGKDGNK